MMDSKQLSALLEAQQEVISKIALAQPLSACLESICRLIEKILDDPQAKSSILLLDGNQLRHGAAPSLPDDYCAAVDGVQIGPCVGSCGTAVFRKERVVVTDLEHDPLWADYKDLALSFALRACWSNPIFSSAGEVLGSFAIYYLEPCTPSDVHIELINRFTHLSSLAIEKSLSSRREAELTSRLRHGIEKFAAFTSVMPDLALILAEDGTYVDVYGADESLLYQPIKSILGKKITDILPAVSSRAVMDVIAKAIATNEVQVFEYELDVAKGECTFEGRITAINHYLPEEPDVRHVLWMARDITGRKSAEKQIEMLAFFDPLTSLPNRRYLIERLQWLIDKAQRNKLSGALLYLDLDDFKRINDSLGHSVGDELLVNVAQRLKPVLRTSDTIARIGGDEFVIILETLEKDIDTLSEEASQVAQKIIEAFSKTFDIKNGKYKIGVSIGISVIHGEDITADEALKRADTAMYRSKNVGGSHFTFFDPALQRILDHRLEIEQGIIQSIKDNQFCAYFQPQMGPDNEVIGAEALIRWLHPKKGVISPLDFIPVAEQFGLITRLQDIVLRESCALINLLIENELVDDSFSVAINISGSQFSNPSLQQDLLDTIREYKLSPGRIKLEITESMLIDNIDLTVKQMIELKSSGFRFSIDDFGTGYSSLTYLQTFPIDELKIDKSFVDNIHTGEVGSGIVDAIIAMSRHLNFNVIAEGVEHKEQADILLTRNVKAMQGYYFARPMPADIFVNWLRQLQTL